MTVACRNSCKKNRSHASWCLKLPATFESGANEPLFPYWHPTPSKNMSRLLVCWDINCPQLSATQLTTFIQKSCLFFHYPTHDFTQWQCQAMSGKPQRFRPKMKPPKGDVVTKRQVSITVDVTVASVVSVSHCRVKDSMLTPFTFEVKWWKLGLVMREVQHGFGRCFV